MTKVSPCEARLLERIANYDVSNTRGIVTDQMDDVEDALLECRMHPKTVVDD